MSAQDEQNLYSLPYNRLPEFNDGYSDYSNDLTSYTCAIQYTKYKTITL